MCRLEKRPIPRQYYWSFASREGFPELVWLIRLVPASCVSTVAEVLYARNVQ
jgi:hypothetical protein